MRIDSLHYLISSVCIVLIFFFCCLFITFHLLLKFNFIRLLVQHFKDIFSLLKKMRKTIFVSIIIIIRRTFNIYFSKMFPSFIYEIYLILEKVRYPKFLSPRGEELNTLRALCTGFYNHDFQIRLYITINILLIFLFHFPFYYPTAALDLEEGYHCIFENYFVHPLGNPKEHGYSELIDIPGSRWMDPRIYDVYTKNGWIHSVLTNYF
jgi:hypothetical protein